MFDRFVVVDWSANSTPKRGRDSIWVAVLDHSGSLWVENPATRAAAERLLLELFEKDRAAATLVGVDFSLGFPHGTAAALGLAGTPWSSMWALLADRITDDDRNANNRFVVASELNRRLTGGAAPFWGCPPSAASDHLATTKPSTSAGLAQFRATEEVLRCQGLYPFSAWQLLGAGAVGGQSLLGIARLHDLRSRLSDRVHLWPFTTGFRPPPPVDGAIVVAEIWPSMLALDVNDGEVRDAAQVAATARWLAATDSEGRLETFFSPVLRPDVSTAALEEEGWALGVLP